MHQPVLAFLVIVIWRLDHEDAPALIILPLDYPLSAGKNNRVFVMAEDLILGDSNI